MMGDLPFSTIAYGISKVSANYAMRKLHFEHPNIVVQPLAPGWVRTEMGQLLADVSGVVKEPPMEVEQSVDGLLSQMDRATKEETSGRVFSYDGEEVPW